jgi:hypothetical protein
MKSIMIVEHNGEQHETNIEKYDAVKIHEQIKAAQSNSTNDYVVVIGDVIIDARSIKKVVPVK